MLDCLIVDDEKVRHDKYSKDYIEDNVDHAYTYDEACRFLSTTKYKFLQLDHDLGDFSKERNRDMTGYDCTLYDVNVYVEVISERCGYELILSGDQVCYRKCWGNELITIARELRKKYDRMIDIDKMSKQSLADEFAVVIAEM